MRQSVNHRHVFYLIASPLHDDAHTSQFQRAPALHPAGGKTARDESKSPSPTTVPPPRVRETRHDETRHDDRSGFESSTRHAQLNFDNALDPSSRATHVPTNESAKTTAYVALAGGLFGNAAHAHVPRHDPRHDASGAVRHAAMSRTDDEADFDDV